MSKRLRTRFERSRAAPRRPWHSMMVCLLTGISLIAVAPALAHKVTVFAWVEGDTVHTESKFSAGRMVQGGKIEVFDANGNKLIEGVTDDQGRFDFSVPKKSDLKIVLAAGMGHSNQWLIHAEELDDAAGQPAMPPPAAAGTTDQAPAAEALPDGPAGPCVDARTVNRIVTLALEKKLAPLEAQLAEEHWRWRDIVAGFGYIMGLMGLASYLRLRQRK